MALTLWDPFIALARFDGELDRLVRRTWGTGRGRQLSTTGFVPAVEMLTEGPDVVIRLELPGVDIDSDVNIEVVGGRLVITGQRRDSRESVGEPGKVLVRELRHGAFRRQFALPEGVSADQVEASYDQGMLEVRVRNIKPAAQPIKIAVRQGEPAQQEKGQPTQQESPEAETAEK
jgi:HSP20 family protein